MDSANPVTDHEPGPGRRLRAERERLGVTVREVAEHLNLTMTVVQAIEADDYARLPGPVFTRGYLRTYARLLQLDPQPLLDRCRYGVGDVVPGPTPSRPSLREWIRRRPLLVMGSAGAVALLALAAALTVLWPDAEPEAAAALAAVEERAAPSPQVPTAVMEPDSEPVETWQAAPLDEEASADSAALPDRAAVEGAVAAEDARRVTPVGNDRIELTFTDDCWVEVRDSAGVNRYSAMARAGSDLVLVGEGPIGVLLGYAPGAALTFNGEPVPLQPHTRNNVANLVLGQ